MFPPQEAGGPQVHQLDSLSKGGGSAPSHLRWTPLWLTMENAYCPMGYMHTPSDKDDGLEVYTTQIDEHEPELFHRPQIAKSLNTDDYSNNVVNTTAVQISSEPSPAAPPLGTTLSPAAPPLGTTLSPAARTWCEQPPLEVAAPPLVTASSGGTPVYRAELTEVTRLHNVFNKQQSARWRLATSTAADRAARLTKFKHCLLTRKEELFEALLGDFGKPRAEVEMTELQPVLMELNHTISHLVSWMRPRRVSTPITLQPSRSEVRREAKGVVLILSPWNYPFNLLISPFIAAVAAGNAVMMRPSDKVKRTSAFMKSLITEAFPEEEAAVITGPSRLADDLLQLPFDHILFTGSTRVGKKIMKEAAAHLTPVTLELGGQSPVIVDESADIKFAAEQIVWGKFLNAGQTCVAPNHVYVPAQHIDAFCDAARTAVWKSYGRTVEERLRSTDLACIIDSNTCSRLADLIDASVERGARTVTGGARDVAARRLEPTILAGVTEHMPIMEEEIFGPILPVLSYEKDEELLLRLRTRSKPLALYIFSTDEDRTERWLSQTTAGGTVVNNVVVHLGNPDLPFGGVGDSGMGAYHGERGFTEFSHERATLHQNTRLVTSRFFRPPYGGLVRGALSLLTKYLGRN